MPNHFVKVFLLAAACLPLSASAQVTNWMPTTGGSWSNPANWSNGVPNSITANAGISRNISDDEVVDLGGGSFTVNALQLRDAGTTFFNWTVSNGTLTFDAANAGSAVLLSENAGATGHVISADIVLNRTVLADIRTLTVLSGNVSGSGALSRNLNSGTLELRSVSGTWTLSLSAGTLRLAGDSDTAFNRNTTILGNVGIQVARVGIGGSVNHTMGTLSIGGQTLTVTAGPNFSPDAAFGLSFGTTTVTGNATFDVADNGGGTGTLTLGALDTGGGARTLVKAGAGTLVLDSTALVAIGSRFDVNGGRLVYNSNPVSNSIGRLAVTVNNGGTLAGQNNAATSPLGAVVVGTGGVLAPGNSVGVLTGDGGLTFEEDAVYEWELSAPSTANGAFDRFDLTGGSLAFPGTPTLSLSFIGTAAAPTASDPFWQQDRTWSGIIRLSGPATNPSNAFQMQIDNAPWALVGSFATQLDGATGSVDLIWTFAPIPEPAGWAALTAGLAFAGLLLRRRKD